MASPSIVLTSEFEVPAGNNYGDYIRYMTRQGVLEAKGDNLTAVEKKELERISEALSELEEKKESTLDEPMDFQKEMTMLEGEALELIKHDLFSSIEQSDDFAQYIFYMGRTNALKCKEKLSQDEKEELGLIEEKARGFMNQLKSESSENTQKEPALTTGLFTLDKNDLTTREEKAMAKQFSQASKKGSILYKDVISFDTAALIREGIYNPNTKKLDREPLLAAGRKMMTTFFKKEGLSETGIWTGMIHYNTNHFHIHFAATELESTRKDVLVKKDGKEFIQPRGKRKLTSLDSMKSAFANELFKRREAQERRSELRNSLVQEIKTELNKETMKPHMRLLFEIRSELPISKKDWNYKRLNSPTREKLNQLVTNLMEENPNYEDYQKLLKEESAFRKNIYGDTKREDKDYFKNQAEDIQKRLGNSFLKELKSIELDVTKAQGIVVESKLIVNEKRKESDHYPKNSTVDSEKKDYSKRSEKNSSPLKILPKEEEETPRESNLEKYSKFNQTKIRSQFPEATFVQGKYSWVKEGRQVKSDALPIEISSPVFELDASGEPTKRVIHFETISIYDISQTEKKGIEPNDPEGKKGSIIPENGMETMKNGETKSYDYSLFTDGTYQAYTFEQEQLYYDRLFSSEGTESIKKKLLMNQRGLFLFLIKPSIN